MTTRLQLLLIAGLSLLAAGGELLPALVPAGAALFAIALVGGVSETPAEKRIKAGVRRDDDGNIKAFTLTLGTETASLDPGKTWIKVDSFKWVTRGLMEGPQAFHVHPDGSIDINGEKINVTDPEAAAKLEAEINKRHTAPVVRKPVPPPHSRPREAGSAPTSGKVQFKVKLDHLGHVMVECVRGLERVETGLRGLPHLSQTGMMIKPKSFHLDPLQRHVEIDDLRLECNEAGARQLEELLNTRYAALIKGDDEIAIHIKENPASATGFDLSFSTVLYGKRTEIKGHLAQEKLDVLQDSDKCDILKAGTILRLSPPYLLARRRRPDGGEEKIPDLPDLQYRRATLLDVQRFLNHPSIRRSGGAASAAASASVEEMPPQIVEMRVVRNPSNKLLLWAECKTDCGGEPQGRALTHHNVAEWQHAGVFQESLDVNLSLDNRTLSVLNNETKAEEHITIDHQSSDEDLQKAGQMLSAALRPPKPRPVPRQAEPARAAASPAKEAVAIPPPVSTPDSPAAAPVAETQVREPLAPAAPLPDQTEVSRAPSTVGPSAREKAKPKPETKPAESAPVAKASGLPAVDAPALAPEEPPKPEHPWLALFHASDSPGLNVEIFFRLTQILGLPVQDVELSLERVFDHRRFEVLSFSHPEVVSVMELRSAEFHGFYLSHINERKVLLVYGCSGKHIEWGPDKCLLQSAVSSDPDEFKGCALLGLARDAEQRYLFVVTPAYKQWAKPREKLYLEIQALFITPEELIAVPEKYSWIWPEKPTAA